jgi:HEAT repeats
MLPVPDPAAPLPEQLGYLVLLYRSAPGRQDRIRTILDRLVTQVAHSPMVIEGGIENNWALGGDPLKERLQIRQVDEIRIEKGASKKELLALAKALADDFEALPSSARIMVRLVAEPLPESAPPRASTSSLPAASPAPRDRSDTGLATLIESVLQETDLAIQQEQWHTVLHDVQAVMRMLPGLSENGRRTYSIVLRRLLTRSVIESLIEQGHRVPEEQVRTAEVLRAGGISAAELVIDILKRSDNIGPRAFLVNSVGGMPEALQVIAPLAKSRRPTEARLGAEILGRLGIPEAVPLLAGLMQHSDERVRLAAVDGLARYRDRSAVEPLRQALGHDSAVVRARAGRALAARGSGAIAMPLLAALKAEREPNTWEELLGALAGIDAPEAAAALSRIALERGGMFGRSGGLVRRQLAVVRALATSNTSAAKQALARIAAEGEGEVKDAAGAALGLTPA